MTRARLPSFRQPICHPDPRFALMTRQAVSDLLLHNFPENGVKFLLHNPGNLHDLVHILARLYSTLPDPGLFDFARRTIEPDTLIRADFSHGVTDLLLRLPFRSGPHASSWIKVYLLFEHLSKHQRHIVPRSLAYAMDAYRLQERRWLEAHESLQGLLYEVVVPIVVYTGERAWQAPTSFRDLVHGGDLFAAFIPATEPLFLSLPGLTEQELAQHGGALGTVLHVLQQRHAELDEFHRLLTRAVETVEGQLTRDRHRLQELLSYLLALVYHFRKEPERAELREELERSIQTQAVRNEVHSMGRTIAEALREEGKLEGILEGKQQTLVSLLRRKFRKKVTAAIVSNVERTTDIATLDVWLGNVLDATTLDEVGVPLKK
jgi:Putative transposase, YhgA-like